MKLLRANLWLVALFCGFCCLYGAFQNVGYFDATDSLFRFKMLRSLITTGSPNWTDANGNTQICLNTLGPAIAELPFLLAGILTNRMHLVQTPLEQTLVRFTLLSNVFYTALWMCLLGRLCMLLGASRRRSVAVCLLAGAGTLIFPYSKSAQGENLVGLGLTAIIILLLRSMANPRPVFKLGIGLLYGFLITCKTELVAMFPLVALAILHAQMPWSLRRYLRHWYILLPFLTGIIPGIFANFWYNHARFGSIWNSGMLGSDVERSLPTFFGHPFFKGLYLQTFSPGKGVFWYCPVMLATMPLCWMFLKRQSAILWLPYAWWALMTCLYAKWFTPTGDTALGSRFQVSYLGFGILPVLALSSVKSAILRAWIVLCFVASFGFQVLFCLVSFNIDFHRKAFAVAVVDRTQRLNDMYYSLQYSLLRGFFSTAREGLLDSYFVRCRPLESALTILPGFWWLLAGAACAFALAIYSCHETSDQSSFLKKRNAIPLLLPAFVLALLGILKVGYPSHEGLHLVLENSGQAQHETIARDIAIKDLNLGREVYMVPAPFTISWSGDMLCPEAGNYSFKCESNRRLKIHMARQDRLTEPGVSKVDFTVLDKGWQSLQIVCDDAGMTDKFIVECKFPGEKKYRPIGERKLKH